MATKFSRKQRLFVAVGVAVGFTCQKIYVASQQMDVTLVLILAASLMPIFCGVIIYWSLGIEKKPWQFSLTKFFAKRKLTSKDDDWAYLKASHEIESGAQDKATLARAIAESDGVSGTQDSQYIKIRVARLIAEKVLEPTDKPFVEDEESIKSRGIRRKLWIGFGLTLFGLLIFGFFYSTLTSNNITKNSQFRSVPDREIVIDKLPESFSFEEASRVPSSTSAKPAYNDVGWTQESTGSDVIGPWLNYSPNGTRYCRYSDGIIQRLYPPGIKPNAKKANPFCLGDSTSSPQ